MRQATKAELLELADLIDAGCKLAPTKITGQFFEYEPIGKVGAAMGYKPGSACAIGAALLAKGYEPPARYNVFNDNDGPTPLRTCAVTLPVIAEGVKIGKEDVFNWIYQRNDNSGQREGFTPMTREEIAAELREVAAGMEA